MKQFIILSLLFLPICLYSQINETFDSSEIPSTWIGKDRNMFNVKGGRLQLGISPTTSGTAVIGMNISYAPDMQWEFDIQMNSAPSDNNKLWVYLYRTDSTEYFNLQIGYNKERKLGLRHNGKDIIRNDGNNYQKDSWVHFKVTLEKNRYWTLYSRQHDSTYYVKEGACDCTVKAVNNGQFCFKFVYTKTKSDLFSIDNIKISNKITPTDTSGFSIPEEQNPTPIELPVIKSLEIIDLSSLQLLFNKAVNIEKAAFNLTDIGLATKQSYADETHERINIFFAKELETDKFYTISYKGIKDLSGNELPEYSQEIKIEKEDEDNNNEKEDNSTITPGSIIINEIMADPKGLTSLPETEYVELHNTTDKALSLAGCLFVYDTSAKEIGNTTISARGYAVLYREGRNITVDDTGIAVPLGNFPAALANTGKKLQLLDSSGKIIDEVIYAKATPAKSWERAYNQWNLSVDPRGGTPGSKNSSQAEEKPDEPEDPEKPEEPSEQEISPVKPNDIIFNELLPEPRSGGSEYIELYNRSDKDLPLSGLSIALRKSDETLSTHYPLSALKGNLKAGNYIALTKNYEGVASFYMLSEPHALHEIEKLPILANTSSTIVLFRTADETIIDEVSYNNKWHAASVKDKKGVSLERISPDKATQDATNWTSAAGSAGFGTPGYKNSQVRNSSSEIPLGIDVPRWSNEGGKYIISYLTEETGYRCRAFVYNTAGQRVATITTNELLGTNGQLYWDGMQSGNRHLPTGIYIFYAELYHSNGKVMRFKKAFPIR